MIWWKKTTCSKYNVHEVEDLTPNFFVLEGLPRAPVDMHWEIQSSWEQMGLLTTLQRRTYK